MTDHVDTNTNEAPSEPAQAFGIQKLYLLNSSFESPNVPVIFQQDWKPDLALKVLTNAQTLEDGLHQVELNITATVKVGENLAFIASVKYAGIFMVKEFELPVETQMLGSLCPNILYPYVRSIITQMVMEGGFPNLYLSPVNFDDLFMRKQKRLAAENSDATPASDDNKESLTVQ